ncbi:MAG TPA: glycosyltransferase, partial [bacterium]|nr:glycosyltransferase [bacterium]
AAAKGLRLLVGIHGNWHHCFLESELLEEAIRKNVDEALKICKGHPAVLAYLVGNEIPPDVVRWYGPERVQKFLEKLCRRIKKADPEALASYANFPSTEYLDTPFMDFLAFNVYLHRQEDFRRYILRLHNLAGDKPLVLTELGIDSIREGRDGQAEILSWQVPTGFECGLAGEFIFAWTDEWFNANTAVKDWAFGLVDENREPKPAFEAVKKHYSAPGPALIPNAPKVSVIVCAYNAERTMEACMASLEKLRYPDYEVIVINDGSRDRTREIAERHPNFQLINQENRGLSAARNVGIEAARGEIIAFTDSDCVADPDWLTYLVSRLLSSNFAGVGGPNLAPREETLVPTCVAVSPGGPTHVLINDEIAEHIPGCNMAFYKKALEAIGGFDPVYRTAGDDVDVCWRLQDQEFKIGFSPAAVVWHYRRNTVKAYFDQQKGYGKAEALLYFKHPDRFNEIGHTRWLGRIYGELNGFLLKRRPVIYYGTFGRGLFQTLYEPPHHILSYLPFTLEWNAAAVLLLLCALASGDFILPASIPLLFSLFSALVRAFHADLDPKFRSLKARLLLTYLIYMGPLVRSIDRYRWRFERLQNIARVVYTGSAQKPEINWLKGEMILSYWSETGQEKEDLLSELIETLVSHNYFVSVDEGWSEWDLQIRRKVWSKLRLKVASENHWGLRRLLKVKCWARMSQTAIASIAVCAAFGILAYLSGLPSIFIMVPVVAGLTLLGVTLYDGFRLSRIVYHALEMIAGKIKLAPVEKRCR